MSLLDPTLPPGLIYIPNWLTSEEHANAVETIDANPFDSSLQRRVQHYGARYDYGSLSVGDFGSAPPIPEVLKTIGERLFNEGYFDREPEQVIVNEYLSDQGISAHIDRLSFGGVVATISLLESWPMLFRHIKGPEKIEVLLERCSLAVMTGGSRYEWTHEIAKRKVVSDGGLKRQRIRRLSLTFRTINS